MRNSVSLKNVLLCGASAVAVGVMMTPALAQETMETVVVTGIRASLQSAQSIKENSDQVVDSITAVDIGALPDRSVAEALQRVPGVTITRTDANRDPVRWAGYGNGVFIRGLSWVQSLTNGHSTFGAENGRTISFADISASLMAGVDVYKNPNAKMIEGGVGGTVDLRTRKPFDQDGRLMAVSLQDDYGDLNGRFAPAVNGLFSNRWNTKVGEIGVLLSADYQDLRASNNVFSLGVYDGWFCNAGSLTGGQVAPTTGTNNACSQLGYSGGKNIQIPFSDAISYRHMDWDQKRVTLYGALQWRPTERLEIGLTTIYSKADPSSVEHVVTWGLPTQKWPGGGPADPYTLTNTPPSAANVTANDGPNANSTYGSNYQYNSVGSWVGGTINNANNVWGGQDTRYGVRHHINTDISLNVKYTPIDALTITADVQYTEARATMYDMTLYTKQVNNQDCYYPAVGWWQGNCPNTPTAAASLWPNAPVINVAANFAGNVPTVAYSGNVAGMQDASQYVWGAAMDHLENNYAHNWTGRLDASYTFEGDGLFGFIKGFDTGIRADLREESTRQSTWNWKQLGYQTWWQGWSWGADGTIGPVRAATLPISQVAASGTELYKFDTFFGQQMPSMWFPKASLLRSQGQKMWGVLAPVEAPLAAIGITGGWQPLSVQYGCTSGADYYCNAVYAATLPGSTSQTAGINTPTEDTFAAYFQTNFGHDLTVFGHDISLDGNAGVRVVTTQDFSGPGYTLYPSVTACTNPPDPCTGSTDREVAYNFVNNHGGTLTAPTPSVNRHYTDVLPTFNLKAKLTDQVIGRVAFSQQIVRPDFAFIQNFTTLSYTFAGVNFSNCLFEGVGLKPCLGGNAGNPGLKPLHADNYDVSLEWYFAPTGNVSLAFFYKDISDYWITAARPITLTRNSITETFYPTSYANGDRGIVKGIEFQYQQFYDFLPGALSGIGLQANYTKIWNSGGANVSWNITDSGGNALAADTKLPLEGMSNDSYNVALMYAKYNIDARLAYNWRSRFLMTTSAANLNQPVWQDKFGQLDGSIFYTIMDHYKIGVMASNILKAKTFLDVGSAAYHPRYEWVDSDRKLSIALRANW